MSPWFARGMRRSAALTLAALTALTCLQPLPSHAQTWPTRPVQLVVPFVPGGATDVVGRIVSDKLAQRLGQPVLIDNKPGAGGNIGATMVANAAPDGHTMFIAGSPGFPNAAALSKNPGFDPEKDFVAVALRASQSMLLTLHPSVPVETLKDLVSYAKANPGKLNYGTPGIGTPHHLAMELLNTVAATDFVHVPFRGGAPMAQAVVSGQVQMMFGSFVVVGPQLKAGKLKVLGGSSKRGVTQAPEVPTIAALGYPDFDVEIWFGVVAPRMTPPAVVERMAREIHAVVETEEIKQRLLTTGYDPPPKLTSAEMDKLVARDVVRWSQLLKNAGIQPE